MWIAKYSNETQAALQDDDRFQTLEVLINDDDENEKGANNSGWLPSPETSTTTRSGLDERRSSDVGSDCDSNPGPQKSLLSSPPKKMKENRKMTRRTLSEDSSSSFFGVASKGSSEFSFYDTTSEVTSTEETSTVTSTSHLPSAMGNIDRVELGKFRETYTKSNVKQSLKKRTDLSFNQLNISSLELVGRESEKQILEDTYEKVTNGDGPRMITIKGTTGTGKSVLAQSLEEIVEDTASPSCSGFFCTGEYDSTRNEPYLGFSTALSDLASQIFARRAPKDRTNTDFVKRVEEAIGEDHVPILLDFAPELQRIGFGTNQGVFDNVFNNIIEGSVANKGNQLHLILRRFFKVVCTKETPLVLVLDNLQWADPSSLLLITSLITDLDNKYFLLVTTSRVGTAVNGIEGDAEQAAATISAFFDSLKIQQIQAHEIILQDLNPQDVHSIVCSALRSKDDDKLQPLTDLLHQKTHGNPSYLLAFLQSLVDEGLIDCDLSTLSFTWNLPAIESKSSTDNVGDLAAASLVKLPPDICMVLKVAACLSHVFERRELMFAIEGVQLSDEFNGDDAQSQSWPENLDEALSLLLKIGILTTSTGWSNSSPNDSMCFSFVHNQTKAAALSLVPYKQRGLLQLAVGKRLIKHMQDYVKLEKYLCLATDLCNSGLKLLKSEDEIADYAKWNLIAGEFSLRKGAYDSATKYFDIGILCLGKDYWISSPKLALALHCGAAEAAYCSGDFEKNERHTEAVSESPCQFPIESTIRIHRARISVLGAQERFKEATDTGRFVMKELGIADIPPNPSMIGVLKDIVKTSRLTQKHNANTLTKLATCKDEKRILAMSIINQLSTMAYVASPNFFLVMYLKAMRWTIKYGYTDYSPVAISTYGLIVCSVLKDTKRGVEFGMAGLELAKLRKLRVARATAISALYGYVYHWSGEMRKCLLPLAYGHQLGMEAGEIELAFLNIGNHDGMLLVMGAKNLPDLVRDMEAHRLSMQQYKQDAIKSFLVVLLQFSLNMMGESDNPLKLSGKAMNESQMRTLAKDKDNRLLEVFMDFWRFQLAYFFGQYETAGKIAETTMDYGVKVGQSSHYLARHTFMVGLVHAALSSFKSKSPKERKKHLKVASDMKKRLDGWAKGGHVNCLHMIRLLEAEILAQANDPRSTEDTYKEAIMATTRVGYLNDRALAHERAAIYFLEAYPDDTFWVRFRLPN